MKNSISRNEATRGRRRTEKGFTLIELLIVISIIALLAAILFPVFARARENARRASCASNLKQIGISIMMYVQDYDEVMPPVSYDSTASARGDTWMDSIRPYAKSSQLFDCPSRNTKLKFNNEKFQWNTGNGYNAATSYGMAFNNQLKANTSWLGWVPHWNSTLRVNDNNPIKLAAINRPSEIIYILEGDGLSTGQIGQKRLFVSGGVFVSSYPPVARHLETTNILFADGHVKAMRKTQFYGNAHRCMWDFRMARCP